MKFHKEDLQSLLDEDAIMLVDPKPGEAKVIKKIRGESRRWETDYDLVFEFDGKLFITNYSVGNTEYQEVSPFEYDPDEIEVPEAEAYTVQITKYRVKK